MFRFAGEVQRQAGDECASAAEAADATTLVETRHAADLIGAVPLSSTSLRGEGTVELVAAQQDVAAFCCRTCVRSSAA